MLKGNVQIKVIDEHCIEILGVKYYRKDFLDQQIMLARQRGYDEGKAVHIAECVIEVKPYEGEDIKEILSQ